MGQSENFWTASRYWLGSRPLSDLDKSQFGAQPYCHGKKATTITEGKIIAY